MTKILRLKGGCIDELTKKFKKHKVLDRYENCPQDGKNLRILENEGKIKKTNKRFLDGAWVITWEWIGD